MGMFDQLKCHYPLPLEGANKLLYQTKDTPSQFMDDYEIRADGTLWHQIYETEDHSEAGMWLAQNPGKTRDDLPKEIKDGGFFALFSGIMTRTNEQWVRVTDFTGEICFYATLKEIKSSKPDNGVGIEWSAYFENGKLVRLNRLTNW